MHTACSRRLANMLYQQISGVTIKYCQFTLHYTAIWLMRSAHVCTKRTISVVLSPHSVTILSREWDWNCKTEWIVETAYSIKQNHLLWQVAMQLKQLQSWRCLCIGSVGTETISEQPVVKLDRILCRQKHYHFALSAIRLVTNATQQILNHEHNAEGDFARISGFYFITQIWMCCRTDIYFTIHTLKTVNPKSYPAYTLTNQPNNKECIFPSAVGEKYKSWH